MPGNTARTQLSKPNTFTSNRARVGVAELLDGAQVRVAGVVYQHVDLSELRLCLAYRPGYVCLACDVHRKRQEALGLGSERPLQRLTCAARCCYAVSLL